MSSKARNSKLTVNDYCIKHNVKLLDEDFYESSALSFIDRKVNIKFNECGHTKLCKISSLRVNEPICITCKRNKRTTEVKREAIQKKPETVFYESLKDIYKLKKSYQIPGTRMLVDFSLQIENKLVLIEIDDENHIYLERIRDTDKRKEKYCKENGISLLRFNKKIINTFLNNHEEVIDTVINDAKPKKRCYLGESDEEQSISKLFYEKMRNHDEMVKKYKTKI
jgi:very-short-patch-repair endonuclease